MRVSKETEIFMYRIMSALYNMNAPIVFKGALVLKAVQLQTGNPSGLERETHDIDGDWVGEKPSMEYLISLLQQAVINSGYDNISVVAKRVYGENKSAGFSFIDIRGREIVSLDLSLRLNNAMQLYCVDGLYFIGQNVNKIIADKIISVSSKVVMRRVKDVIDLYILSYSWSGTNWMILEVVRYLERSIGDFDRFLNMKDDLRHAYSKYKNKASILDFDVVYNRVYQFLCPFIMSNVRQEVWNGDSWG